MRKILWVLITLVLVTPCASSGIEAAPKDELMPKEFYEPQKNMAAIIRHHADGKEISISEITGNDENAKFLRIFAEFINKITNVNARLDKVSANLVEISQPAKMTDPQAIIKLQKAQSDDDKEISSISMDYDNASQDFMAKLGKLDKEKMKGFADPTNLARQISEDKPKHDRDVQAYVGLSQYAQALLKFVASRNTSYQIGRDGILHFSSPEDQKYYNQLITSTNQYSKIIDNTRKKDNTESQAWADALSQSVSQQPKKN